MMIWMIFSHIIMYHHIFSEGSVWNLYHFYLPQLAVDGGFCNWMGETKPTDKWGFSLPLDSVCNWAGLKLKANKSNNIENTTLYGITIELILACLNMRIKQTTCLQKQQDGEIFLKKSSLETTIRIHLKLRGFVTHLFFFFLGCVRHWLI